MATKKKKKTSTASKKKLVKKKKVARRPAAKKIATKAARRNIKYGCKQGFCTATPKKTKMNPGDQVDLTAQGSTVTINFPAGSPFVSGTNPIVIPINTTRTETVKPHSSLPKTYLYSITCDNQTCRTVIGDPEMIVE